MSGEELRAALERETERMGIALSEVFVMNHIDQSQVISWDALAGAVIRAFIRPADPRVPALAPSTPEPSGPDDEHAEWFRQGHAAGFGAGYAAGRRAAPSTPEPSEWRDPFGEALRAAAAERAAPSTEPASCGVLARCGRPKDHRGHHGGWRT